MGRQSRRRKAQLQKDARRIRRAARSNGAEGAYRNASALAQRGEHSLARRALGELCRRRLPNRLQALVENDLGALAMLVGEIATARSRFERALTLDPAWQVAKQNLH